MVGARRTQYSYLGRCVGPYVLADRSVADAEVMESYRVRVLSMGMCQRPAGVLTRTTDG